MATKIIEQGTPAPTPQTKEALKARMDGVVFDAAETLGLASLCLWINEARHLIEMVRSCADLDEGLRQSLRKFKVPINDAEWETETMTGMHYLILHQRGTLKEIREAAEEAAHCIGARHD